MDKPDMTTSTPQTLPGNIIDLHRDEVADIAEKAGIPPMRAWPFARAIVKMLETLAQPHGAAPAMPEDKKPVPSSVTEIVSLMMPYVRACIGAYNAPRERMEETSAEVLDAFMPLEAALTALVEERDRLRFELDGVNAMAKLEKREPLSDGQIGLLSTCNTFRGMHPDYLRDCVREVERAHGIGAPANGEGAG